MAEETSGNETAPEVPAPTAEEKDPRFAELEELQREIERRIRDNRKFLEHFQDEDFVDDDGDSEGADEEEDFEEL